MTPSSPTRPSPGRPGAPDRDIAIHEARRAAKRARYAAEVLGRTGRRTRLLQETLGEHTFTYGLLYQREADIAGEVTFTGLRGPW